ncbi:hypothetical protein ACU686_36630 [Yinghuangia aomiensis]
MTSLRLPAGITLTATAAALAVALAAPNASAAGSSFRRARPATSRCPASRSPSRAAASRRTSPHADQLRLVDAARRGLRHGRQRRR